MEAKVGRVILFTDDIGRMKEFYAKVLGLEELQGGDEVFVSFNAGGIELSLHQLPGKYADAANDGAPREDSYAKIVFRSADVAADRASLTAKGVRMREIVRYGEIELCDGFDPEGNVFQISNR